ncbi:MAG: hypothetical protein HGB10_07065, partial [Coriobacteriia bacterium]|nr:hypothetical protein [Coriobacteriia bacterium]
MSASSRPDGAWGYRTRRALLALLLTLALALAFALPALAADGTLVDAGFESGAEGAALATPPWINVGTTLHREYDDTRAAAGSQSAW